MKLTSGEAARHWWLVSIGSGNGLVLLGSNHYLCWCWPRSISPYDTIRPQVNYFFFLSGKDFYHKMEGKTGKSKTAVLFPLAQLCNWHLIFFGLIMQGWRVLDSTRFLPWYLPVNTVLGKTGFGLPKWEKLGKTQLNYLNNFIYQ